MSEEKSLNFIEEIIEKDLAEGKHQSIITRFPQSPMVICILVMQKVFV
jgi:glutaminyl-tRNA synthetase